MRKNNYMPTRAADKVAMSAGAAAPVWYPTLQDVNMWLSFFSLLFAVAFGAIRFFDYLRDRRKKK